MLEVRSLAASDGGEEESSAFDKEYLAIVRGTPADCLLEEPLELDPENSLRVKMRVAAPGTGLPAKTGVRVLETRGAYSLVSCSLHTGRQHQIRIHLANQGHPLVGDKLYGPDERLLARAADGELTSADIALLELPRHALHAHRYRLRHAVTGEALELVSPLAGDLARFWQSLAL
jgi:23S rRNA pseudouridine1911/1915/1917 synthase